MIIDTHCHLMDNAFEEDRDSIIKSAFSSNVKVINCSIDYESSLAGVALIKKFIKVGNIFTSIGFDPQMSLSKIFSEDDFDELLKNERQNIVAIGECGLEFFKQDNYDEQIEIFEKQIILANKYDLPLIIHCRDFSDYRNRAFETLIDLIDKHKPLRRGVVHCFTGSADHVISLNERGFYVGFNGIITFDKSGLISDALCRADRTMILAETDSPYLSPTPFRGQRNDPLKVLIVVKKIADILNISFDSACDLLESNAKKLFSLP